HKNGTRIAFMDPSTGKSVRKLDLANIGLDQMQFTPDGKKLVFSGWSGMTVVDLATGKAAKAIELDNRVSTIALTSDGKWVAAQPQKSAYHVPVGIWEAATGKQVASLPGRGAGCSGLAFGPNAKRLLLWSIVPLQAGDGGISWGSGSKVAL